MLLTYFSNERAVSLNDDMTNFIILLGLSLLFLIQVCCMCERSTIQSNPLSLHYHNSEVRHRKTGSQYLLFCKIGLSRWKLSDWLMILTLAFQEVALNIAGVSPFFYIIKHLDVLFDVFSIPFSNCEFKIKHIGCVSWKSLSLLLLLYFHHCHHTLKVWPLLCSVLPNRPYLLAINPVFDQ